MKLIGILFAVFIIAAETLVPGVYNWESSPSTQTKTGSTKKIFKGSGAILTEHTMLGVTLLKGKAMHYGLPASGNETFFIVKSGPVNVTLNGQLYIIGRGSVILLLPGDKIRIENKEENAAEFYVMEYHSASAADNARGKTAGGSFIMNWNDMVFKPNAKGGTRQLFTRSTAMLNRFDIHVTQLNEGNKSHEPHTHTNEEIILLLDGNAEMQIGTEHPKANAGDIVFLGSNVLHNLTNIGKTPCLYFAIQWN
jgi:(S)-ureidoglycine aminohydrolase